MSMPNLDYEAHLIVPAEGAAVCLDQTKRVFPYHETLHVKYE